MNVPLASNTSNAFMATAYCGLVFVVVAMGCRRPSTTLQDYLHRGISVEEFRVGESASISIGQTLAVPPGQYDVTFRFGGDETKYELEPDPKMSIREIDIDGAVGKQSMFPCTVSRVESAGETSIVISSSILIDYNLRARKAYIEVYSKRELIARKSLSVLP